jgi:hypothetical protein
MANHIHLSPEELYSNYEYKVTVKALKREFPFIKDVRIDEESINRYGLIFIELYIDPYEMAKTYNLTPSEYVISSVMKGEDYFNGPVFIPTIYFKEGLEQIKPITEAIDRLVDEVHDSKAIPSTMKMYQGRRLSVGGYVVIPEYVSEPDEDQPTGGVDNKTTV